MLQVPATFPYPGSIAAFAGLRWRVLRHHNDGTALLGRDGPGASFTRTAALGDLIDPQEADENARITLCDLERATQRICLFLETHLRGRNEVALADLAPVLAYEARQERIPLFRDNAHIAQCIRALGWRKDGYRGEGAIRSPVYRRTGAQVAA